MQIAHIKGFAADKPSHGVVGFVCNHRLAAAVIRRHKVQNRLVTCAFSRKKLGACVLHVHHLNIHAVSVFICIHQKISHNSGVANLRVQNGFFPLRLCGNLGAEQSRLVGFCIVHILPPDANKGKRQG